DHIKLVSTAGKKGVYITLSHRWGARKKLRTLKENLKVHLGKINAEDMSQTFKDAVEVTRDLGAQYLWIDSLCIIQDDMDDWAFEAAQMGKIFEQAYCTIAAVDAINDNTDMDRGLQ
ncbi:heterokaryon incompatibility, partial [Zopfia rhizophila CBS 207.26]